MDLSGKRVLIFGDSLTHRGARSSPDGRDVTEGIDRDSSPGDLLASYLLQQGARSARINGRVSRSAYNFFRIEDAGGILAEEVARDPDVVFVFLGTNDLGLNQNADASAFQNIRNAFHGVAEVYAIGPPMFASETANQRARVVYATLSRVFGAGHVFDLRPLTRDLTEQGRTSDGIHFTGVGARTVAARLASVIADYGQIALRPLWKPVGVSLGLAAGAIGLAWIIRRRRMLGR